MLRVTLTWPEVSMGAAVGMRRHMSALSKGLKDKHGYDGDGWGPHIEGALGEMAVAKAFGVYWDGSVDTFKLPDLPGIQVRTRPKHDYDLIIRDTDSPEDTYVLVTGTAPSYRVVGWIDGQVGMRHDWSAKHAGRPTAFFVPIKSLNSIESLRKAMTYSRSLAS
jgi:hypothetical protein